MFGRTAILVPTILLLLPLPTAVHASDSVIIRSLNAHRFLSAPQIFPNYQSIHYEVCNTSNNANGFHWKSAGFGVGAPDELSPGYCATRRLSGFPSYRESLSSIDFQDGAGGTIDTWVACDVYFGGAIDTCGEGLLNEGARLLSSVALFARYDESNIEMEAISIALSIDSGSGEIRVTTSEGYKHPVSLVFPMSDTNLPELRNMIESDGAITFNTFSYYRDNLDIDASLLAEEIPSHSPVISLSVHSDFSGYNQSLKVADISRLGRLIVALTEKQNRIAVRNDLPIPAAE